MTWLVAVGAILVAWNPALFAERAPAAPPRRKMGWLVAATVVVLMAAGVDPILDLLDVSTPTFRTAAGAVVALAGARWLVGPPPRSDGGDELTHGMMDVASPEIVAAALAAGTAGWLPALGGVGAGLALSLALSAQAPSPRALRWMCRLLAGGAVAAGIVLVYVGIRAV